MCTISKKLTIVYYERVRKKKMLAEKIITDNCLLREKNNIKFIGKIKCVQKNRNLFAD